MKEMLGGCCVCSDERGWPENPLVYCDGQSCTVAVHQACYGIVTVPSGPWFCRKCETQERSVKVKCELCPSKYGALKQTDNSGWAHVVCALYIPEVRFGNVTTMEPIQLQLIPTERFNKVCYICEENSKPSNATVGACMQCNKAGCKQTFHVTCAQGLGLLCEEAGNYLDNVKYCGYCQHHYSKLRKGGNVKTIPPYKPVSTENHLSDSNSEKDADANSAAANLQKLASTVSSSSSSQPTSTKRKSSSNSKTSSSSSKTANSNAKSSAPASSKVAQAGGKSAAEKPKVAGSASVKSAKNSEENSAETDSKNDKVNKVPVKDSPEVETKEIRETKGSKKRKNNSRTPTPVSVVPSESVASAASNPAPEASMSGANAAPATTEKKDGPVTTESVEKPKKAKTEPNIQSTTTSQSAVALTSSTSAVKSSSPLTSVPDLPGTTSPTASNIQSASGQQLNSLVVSVPLLNTNLSPHSHVANNQTNPVASQGPFAHLSQERFNSSDRSTPNNTGMTGGANTPNSGMITTELSSGRLKVTYEKQPSTPNNVSTELERVTPTSVEQPVKRTRSQSGDKTEKNTRTKKRNSNGVNNQFNNSNSGSAASTSRRASRSQNSATPPQPQPGAFASISQIKDSPPSSPSSESQGAPPMQTRRVKGRKSAPASTSVSRDSKDNIKLFQNGIHAPHMLGNQLNPNSNMAQKMTDHLNSELEAHSIFNPSDNNSNIIGPQLHHRVIANARASSTGSTASGGSGLSSMLGGGGGAIPQTLDQLLERQWEQGSQFLMEQAQHFDIASLLSCLHQLRAENLRLEEHVSSLLQRRDHLLAVNARLAIPLTGQPSAPQSSHPHTVNNIHPAVAASHGDIPRSSRHSGGYPAQPQGSSIPTGPIENGLPPDSNQAYQHSSHRSPAATQPQPSPTVRHSPAGSGYPNSGLLRQSADTSGRSAPRPQPYPLYQGPGPSAQSQMVIRRDPDMHHQSSSKPS